MDKEQESQLRDDQKEDILIRDTFSTPSGIATLELLKDKFYNRPDYNPEELQPFHTFFRSGQRDVIGFLIESIDRGSDLKEDVKVKKNL